MIINSIDIMNGKAVQLEGGRDKKIEREDIESLARKFAVFGEVAVIDLDAAAGTGSNLATIEKLCKLAECRVGGGIRTPEDAGRLSAAGAKKLIVGTQAVKEGEINREFLSELSELVGRERLIVALDVYEEEVVTGGWQKKTGHKIREFLPGLDEYVNEILVTVVEKEGRMKGTDIGFFKKLAAETSLKITSAGGISTYDEIRELSRLGLNIQLGMAVYSGKLTPEESFLAGLKQDIGLIPMIIRDDSGQVLMLGYGNDESLMRTFETRTVWFYSRSRQRLWQKGETSGNYLRFRNVRVDCDSDALLIEATPSGPTCHTGGYSCFGPREFSLSELETVIEERFRYPAPGSYTARLTDELINEKLLEEAGELTEARDREEIIWEAADLLYFTLTKMVKNGVRLSEVLYMLESRRRTKRNKKAS